MKYPVKVPTEHGTAFFEAGTETRITVARDNVDGEFKSVGAFITFPGSGGSIQATITPEQVMAKIAEATEEQNFANEMLQTLEKLQGLNGRLLNSNAELLKALKGILDVRLMVSENKTLLDCIPCGEKEKGYAAIAASGALKKSEDTEK